MEIELVDKVDNHVKYGIIYAREDVKECLDQEIEAMKPDLKVKGFRPGKVPSDYIVRMYGEKLRIQAMNKKVTADITAIITDNKYDLAGQPVYKFRPRQDIDDNNFYVELDLFLMPSLPTIEFETVKLDKYQPNEDAFQEILDKNLLMFQIMTSEFEDVVGKPSEENDKITFTTDITINGEPSPNLSGQMQAILGQEQIPAEIEAQLKGVQTEQDITYTHNYPQDATELFSPELAGSETVYNIKINKIERPILKELDEDRIQKIGFKDYEHLFEVLENNTRSTMSNITFVKMKYDFLAYLHKTYANVQVPEFILSQEAHHVAIEELSAHTDDDVMERFTTGSVDLNITEKHLEDATKHIRIGLFIKKYSNDNNIIVTDTEVKRELERHLPELTRLNKIKPEQKEQNYRKTYIKARAIVIELKVFQSIFERISVTDVLLSKDDYFSKVKAAIQ